MLLMVINFAFGGKDLLVHNKDVVTELGHHDYFLAFQFGEEIYRFCRDTGKPGETDFTHVTRNLR